MERFDINDAEGNLYLRRWRLIQTPLFGVYLHKIMQPDADRDLHDHPWNFISIVLSGGYSEQVEGGFVKRKLFSIARRTAATAHRIARLFKVPTWTLVLVGRRKKSWGFYTPSGFKDWREYLGVSS